MDEAFFLAFKSIRLENKTKVAWPTKSYRRNHMGEIIPRWEWRTFGKEFGVGEERIKKYEQVLFKKSSEKYILSRKSNENCKIRDDLMDIKSLRQVNEDKLEQWYPTMKLSFPLKK